VGPPPRPAPPPLGPLRPPGGEGICIFDLDDTLLGASGAKKEDRMGAICKDAGFSLGVVTAGGAGPQRVGDAAAILGVAPAAFKFCTSTYARPKGEVIAGQLARPRVILFDDNPDYAQSARDWGFCSSDAQAAAIRANHGVNAQIVRGGIAACVPRAPHEGRPPAPRQGGAPLGPRAPI